PNPPPLAQPPARVRPPPPRPAPSLRGGGFASDYHRCPWAHHHPASWRVGEDCAGVLLNTCRSSSVAALFGCRSPSRSCRGSRCTRPRTGASGAAGDEIGGVGPFVPPYARNLRADFA